MKPIVKTMNLSSGIIEKATREDYISKVIPEDFQSYGNVIEPPYNPENLKTLRYSSIYHRKCLKAVAVDVTRNGWTCNSKEGKEEGINKELLEALFDDYSFESSFFKAVEDFNTYGYGAVEIGQNLKGDIIKFTHIRATTLRMCKGGEKAMQRVGTAMVYYKIAGKREDEDLDAVTGNFSASNKDTPEIIGIPEEDKATTILWIGDTSPDSDYYGEPSYLSALLTILSDEYLREYNNNTFITNGIPNYFITVTGNFEEEADPTTGLSFADDLEAQLMDLQNKPGTAVVFTIPTTDPENKIDIQVTKISEEQKEASFEAFRASNRDEILAAHEVPPSRLGIVQNGPLAGSVDEERNKLYNDKTVRPLQRMIEQLINTLIIQGMMDIQDTTFQYRGLDTRNIASEVDVAIKLLNSGAMKPVELRERFGDVFDLVMDIEDNPIIEYSPELDEFYMNGQPLGMSAPPEISPPEGINKSLNDKGITALEMFKKDMVGLVEDELSTKDGSTNRRVSQILEKLKP